MGDETQPLRIFFFPFQGQGHLIPMIDMARLFASQGVQCSIITTPANSTRISKSNSLGLNIVVRTIPLYATQVGLPEDYENMDKLSLTDLSFKFFQALNLLQKPLENLLVSEKPDCLISDFFFPWSADLCNNLNIPRISFSGMSCFALCAMDCLKRKKPYKSVTSDAELFCIPDLPDEIKMTRNQIPIEVWEDPEKEMGKILADADEAEVRSYGVVVNSFLELESGYADYYRNVINKKAWFVGPVSACNRNVETKCMRGKESAIEDDQCLKWLDEKESGSVMYVCFGSYCSFPDAQLRDIALGLEFSGKNFIWVVRRNPDSISQDYLPDGFEERVKDRGLLIRGWAPQLLILDHPSVGGFMTHCGWNSTLEGITAGLPFVTWPIFADQFFNEKLITDVLKIGVGVGVKKWSKTGEDHIDKENVEKAVRIIMEGDEMHKRATELGKMAKKATEKGGSSHIDVHNLLEDLKSMRKTA